MSAESADDGLPRTAALEEARHSSTSPDRLRTLARQRGEVARAVAGNPNTPTEVLLRLASEHWEALLANPVLPLLLLEDPGLPLRLPREALLALLRTHEPPPAFLQTLQRHGDPEVRDAARLHRRVAAAPPGDPLFARLDDAGGSSLTLRELLSVNLVPPWVLRWAMESGSRSLRELAWARAAQSADPAIVEHQQSLRWYDWLGGRKPKKEHERHVSSERLEEFSRGGVFARQLAARNRATPPATLARLATDPSQPRVVRQLAAKNPHTPPEALLSLAMTGDPALRRAVVRNRSTPAAALEQLAASSDLDVRRRVAANRSTPPATLARLAQDADTAVRERVAANTACDLATSLLLAADPEEDVRERLALRPRLPMEVLKRLCADKCAYVRFRVIQNPSWPDRDRLQAKFRWLSNQHRGYWDDVSEIPSVLDFPDDQVPPSVWADTPGQSPPTLETLSDAGAGDVELRRRAARHKDTSPETLAILATDPDVETRQSAARHPRLPASAHALLAADPELWVRANLGSRQPIAPEIFDLLRLDPEFEVRVRMMGNPHLSAEQKDALMRREYSPEMVQKVSFLLAHLPEVTVLWLLEQQPVLANDYGLRSCSSPAVRAKIISLLSSWERSQFIASNGYQLRKGKGTPLTDEELLQLVEPNGEYPDYEREYLAKHAVEYRAVSPRVLEILARRQMTADPPSGCFSRKRKMQTGGSLALIAAHPRTPPPLLAELANHWNRRVRVAALNNPNTPAEAKATRAEHVISEVARGSSLLGRVCALSHAAAPLASLRRAAFDGGWTERFAVAQNPKCPRDLLALLREDANVAVRDAARAQWQARFSADES